MLFRDSHMTESSVMIGLHRPVGETTFRWIDGTMIDYDNWYPFQPDGSLATDQQWCVIFYRKYTLRRKKVWWFV